MTFFLREFFYGVIDPVFIVILVLVMCIVLYENIVSSIVGM
jgi:hypothetical protein